MEQLTGMDASFLYSETNTAPMHIGPLFIYDVSTAPNGFVRFKDILRTFEQRLDRSTVFRRKLATVPLSLDQPYWVEDENFDLEFHVRHIALPKPGDWRQLCIQVARLHTRSLDRARPLWEVYVIEGLDNVEGLPKGSFALFLKIHHAAIDGATGTEIMGAIHDLSPEPEEPPSTASSWQSEPMPSSGSLLWRAYLSNLRHPFRLARLAGKSVPALRRLRAGRKEKKFRDLGEKERTRFNGAVSAHRVFGAVSYDLGEVRRIKQVVDGATVNDVMLTIVGGALYKYLASKGETPEKSLVTGAPVNVRTEEEAGTGGNVVSMMSISLRTDIADPLERLQTMHDEAVQSKAYHKAMGARMMTDLSNSLPSHITVLAFRAASAAGLLASTKPIFNTILTNVPGPQVPLYMCGAELVRSLAAGPCMDNMGLFHPVTSYNGMIAVSFQACREMLPDPHFYEECLQQSFAE
ncbi:MAG: wax ester/triacylglycerol synthase family O-acyltransferase, partial [Candidatus Tectomicrobia bacterium]